MTGHPDGRAPASSRVGYVVALVIAYKHYIALTLIGAVVAGVLAGVSPPAMPLRVKVAALAVTLALALGYAPVSKFLNYLYDPPKRFVVSLGLSGNPGIYQLTPAAWERVEVVDGELHQWENVTWPTYEVEEFDADEMTAVGTWRGSKPDSDLLKREKEIGLMREKLERQADTAIDTEIAISSKVRQAVKEIGQAIITEHAEASTYNGEKVADVLSEIRQDVEEDSGQHRNGDVPENETKPVEDPLEALDRMVSESVEGEKVENGRKEQ